MWGIVACDFCILWSLRKSVIKGVFIMVCDQQRQPEILLKNLCLITKNFNLKF